MSRFLSNFFYFDKDKYEVSFVDVLLKKYGNNIKFSNAIEPYVTLMLKNQTEKQIIKEIKEFLSVF